MIKKVYVRIFFGIILAICCLQIPLSFAQTVPKSAEPGRVEEQFRPLPLFPSKKPLVTTSEPEKVVSPEGADKITFVLKKVELEGVNAYSHDYFSYLYADEIGKKIALSRVYEIANEITKKYSNDGYVFSIAIVPPQEIEDGVARIQVIESYVSEVVTDGNYRNSRINRHALNKIKNLKPFNIKKLERYTLLLNDLSDVEVKTLLSKVEGQSKPGAIKITLFYTEKKAQTVLGYDNFGSRYLGPHQVNAETSLNNLMGIHDQTRLKASTSIPTDEIRYFNFSETVPINAEGTNLTIVTSRSDSNPGFDIKNLDLKSTSYVYGFSVSQNLIRSRRQNLSIEAELLAKDSSADISGSIFSKDKLRVASIYANFDNIDSFHGVNIARIGLSQGLDILGNREDGSPHLSRTQGRSDFTKITLTAARLQNIVDNWGFYLAFSGQYSSEPLLSAEEFGFGGQNFGRAYDYSEITGDHGMAGLAELRYETVEIMPQFPSEIFVYYDAGKVWNTDSLAENNASGSSAGGGIRIRGENGLSGTFLIAQPLNRPIAAELYGNGKNPRFYLGINYNF